MARKVNGTVFREDNGENQNWGVKGHPQLIGKNFNPGGKSLGGRGGFDKREKVSELGEALPATRGGKSPAMCKKRNGDLQRKRGEVLGKSVWKKKDFRIFRFPRGGGWGGKEGEDEEEEGEGWE